jgi:hypothetical protein
MMKKLALGALTALVLGAGIAAAPAALAAPPDPAAPNGIELQGPSMCTDPIDCPPGDGSDGQQLPGETDGRAIDCPDGSVAAMHDSVVDCPRASAVPTQSAPAQAAPGKAPVAPAPAVAVGTGSRAPHGVSGSAALAQLRDFLVEFLLRTFGMSH